MKIQATCLFAAVILLSFTSSLVLGGIAVADNGVAAIRYRVSLEVRFKNRFSVEMIFADLMYIPGEGGIHGESVINLSSRICSKL